MDSVCRADRKIPRRGKVLQLIACFCGERQGVSDLGHVMKRMLLILFSLIFFPAFPIPAEAGTFDWSAAEPLHESYEEILFVRKHVDSPRKMDIRAARIDTGSPRIRFYATPRSDKWGEPIGDTGLLVETRRERTDNFIEAARERGIRVALAINASGWRPWPRSPWDVNVRGLLISQGVKVSPGDGRPSFIEDEDFSARLDTTRPGYDIRNIRTAATGFFFVLEGGEVIQRDGVLHPRTGIGVSEDGRYVYFLTIDGRRPQVSRGATTGEVGQWLKRFGSYSGVNMDGGGSTTIAWWNPDTEAAEILNSTSDAYPRHVASNLGVSVIEAGLELKISGKGVVCVSDPDAAVEGDRAYFEAHYNIGDEITLTAENIDGSGYIFSRWILDGSAENGSALTFNAAPDRKAKAIFIPRDEH